MPRLLLKFNAAVIREIAMAKDRVSVGRKPDNDVVIDNPAISGHHCRICLEGGTYYVEDLDSTNGTFVNQKRVKKTGLHHNDVVGVAKHSLVFLEDQNADSKTDPAMAPVAGDATMVMAAKAPADAAANGAVALPDSKVGVIRVLKGVVGNEEFELKGISTYIGKSDRVQIAIKGSGLFGSAPEVAAAVHRKPEGYVLMAVEPGYPIVNGTAVSGFLLLKDGDLIDCGGTTMQFVVKDISK